MTGFFATIEGIDGSGKTTVAEKVANSLAANGISVERTTEPTRTWRGNAVRWAIEREVDATSEAFLFLADREAHRSQILAWLSEEKVVLSDRYADSTYAYQGARLAGRREKPVEWLQEISSPFIVTPHVTYFLAVAPETAIARIRNRSKRVRFEDLSFLTEVDAIYRRLAKDPRFVTMDATKPAEAVASHVAEDLRGRLRQ